jgi:hypothetical protein
MVANMGRLLAGPVQWPCAHPGTTLSVAHCITLSCMNEPPRDLLLVLWC